MTVRLTAALEAHHHARIETVLTLSAADLLYDAGEVEALAALGVRPPVRFLPTRDASALDLYVMELLDLVDTIARVAEDPEGLWRVDGYRRDLDQLIGESLAPTQAAALG